MYIIDTTTLCMIVQSKLTINCDRGSKATVTAEISTMRLDMGDMQEALKAHDAWMEDVSQSLQEVHERCQQLSEDIESNAQSTQTKLDAKTDITAWNDMTDDIDASIKTVRDMASALRLEVDSRRRKVDEDLSKMREQMKILQEKVDNNASNIQRGGAQLKGLQWLQKSAFPMGF